MNKKIKLINSVHKETTFGIGEGILTELSKNEGKNPPSKIIVLERHSVIEKESMHHDSYNILLVKILDNNYLTCTSVVQLWLFTCKSDVFVHESYS